MIVLLHPIGLDAQCWQFLRRYGDADTLALDMLWHGRRAPLPPGEELSILAFAEDVRAQLPTSEPVDVVGLSMGGAVAQVLALGWPEIVRSVMLVSSSAGGRGGNAQRERAEATERLGMAGMLDSTLERWFTPAALVSDRHPGVQYTRQTLLHDDPRAFAASWRALSQHDAVASLPHLTTPTSVVHGIADRAGGIELKRAMVERLPTSRLIELPGPHMLQLENPTHLDAALDEHLAWVESLAGPKLVQPA